MTTDILGMKSLRRALRLFPVIFLFAACAGPGPHDIALDGGDCSSCQEIFPNGGWQFVHEIIFRFGQGEGSFLGIVALDDRELRCALTTVEGLTVFAARAPLPAGEVQVERALPPLDKPGFAAGLVADLRLLFTAPAGVPRCGWRDGKKLCRWENPGLLEDISISQDGCWTIQAFTGGRLARTARASACAAHDGYAIPGVISLRASGDASYELQMRLVSADRSDK